MEELSLIKSMRKKIGLTQAELAHHSQVSQSLIAKIEAGKIEPSYNNAKRLFDTLTRIGSKDEKKAKDIVNARIISLSPEESIKDAILKMKKYEISQLPVIKEQHPIGYVSEGILIDRILKSQDHNALVSEVMEDAPPTVPMNTNRETIIMLLKQFPFILVKDREKIKGIITKADLINALYR